MDKKKMVIIGLIAAAGIGLYFWSKSKKAQPATAGGSAPTSGAAQPQLLLLVVRQLQLLLHHTMKYWLLHGLIK